MGIVFPCETDTTEYLDAVPGDGERSLGRRRAGNRCGQRRFGSMDIRLRGLRGIPSRHCCLLGQREHSGDFVFDSLELADGPAELLTGAGVSGRSLGSPTRKSRCLGGEKGSCDIEYPLRVEIEKLTAHRNRIHNFYPGISADQSEAW